MMLLLLLISNGSLMLLMLLVFLDHRDRQDYASDMEAQRSQRWRGRGPASGRRGPSEFGTMEGARKRSRKDFLGYYRLMGIEEGRAALALPSGVMSWHIVV